MGELGNSGLQDPAYMAQRIAVCEREIQKGIIGQREIIRQVMLAMLTGQCAFRGYAWIGED